ncbi:prealbumin-like fold domain-containing protein [Blautia sp. HCP3S3_G3]|uniref:prealbumin-like fold domain-containing protein n=1 Tax=Blautia sp. HCP3S3_G3 TaxID=3438913 RepID=UPI003F89E983
MTVTKQKKWNGKYFGIIMVIVLLVMAGIFMYQENSGISRKQEDGTSREVSESIEDEKSVEVDESADDEDVPTSAVDSDIYAQEGILHLRVLQHGGSENDRFTLVIRINDEKYQGKVIVDGTEITTDDGKVKLKGGQRAEIGGIAYGSSYHVIQKKDISYTTTVNGTDTRETDGVISEDCPEATEVFVNTLGRGSMTLGYTCESGMNCPFMPFTVRIGGDLYDGTVHIGDAEISVTDGIVWLTENKTAEFSDIPFGTAYEITVQKYGNYPVTVDGMEICEDSGIVSGQNEKPEVNFEIGGLYLPENNAAESDSSSEAMENDSLSEAIESDLSSDTMESHSGKTTIVEIINTGFAGTVFLKVKDGTGNPIEGIRYQLFAKGVSQGEISECWETYDRDEENGIYTTNSAGVLMAPNLPANEYYFAELKNPDSYELSGKKYVFAVTQRKIYIKS